MQHFVGTAGWTVPKQHLSLFPAENEQSKPSHLERYASRFNCVEVNSSFHRPHRRSTWERWAASVSDEFRFAVKMSKAVTHTAKLQNTGGALLEFFEAVNGLGHKLGPVLVQLPPRLSFNSGVAQEFFTTLRELHAGPVVLEPRHPDWFTGQADQMLRSFQIARVAADPPKGSNIASRPGGWRQLAYWRLHGSPRTYYSNYDGPWLDAFAAQLQSHTKDAAVEQTWIIFDNTALGHATGNAVWLQDALLGSCV